MSEVRSESGGYIIRRERRTYRVCNSGDKDALIMSGLGGSDERYAAVRTDGEECCPQPLNSNTGEGWCGDS